MRRYPFRDNDSIFNSFTNESPKRSRSNLLSPEIVACRENLRSAGRSVKRVRELNMDKGSGIKAHLSDAVQKVCGHVDMKIKQQHDIMWTGYQFHALV